MAKRTRNIIESDPIPFGTVAADWSVAGWATRLRYMADVCEQDHAERAGELRRWADAITTPQRKIDFLAADGSA